MKFCFNSKDFIEKDKNPNKLALIGDDFELTWEQFNLKVNDLIDFLSEKELCKSKRSVVVYGHKSANMLVSIYALMKLDVPYIPVDKVYPKERIQKILNSSESNLIINTTENDLGYEGVSELKLKQNKFELLNKVEQKDLKENSEDPLVYTIFTSGSTGEPKGVQITTEAVQSFTRWMTSKDFGFLEKDVFINTALLSFDLSVFEVMTFGAIGGTLLLNNKEQNSDPNKLMERINQYKGTVWVSTPSFAILYSRIDDHSLLNSIKSFLFCGEVLPHNLAKTLVSKFKNAQVINTYGPTEATVATTIVHITEELLDKYNPLPVGVSKMESKLLIENGEIVIAGPNVSIGYVKNERLNAEKFVMIDNQRAFKTGDVGYLENDMLFFNGRNDDLVKLHGYRIELNEITSSLNDLSYIAQAETIALKRNGSVKKIVSLAKIKPNESKSKENILSDLSKTLPMYMVPSDIKIIDNIPLNNNGKTDKKLLAKIYLGK